MASSRGLQYRGGTTDTGSKLQEGGWRHPGEMERPLTTCRDPIALHKWDGKIKPISLCLNGCSHCNKRRTWEHPVEIWIGLKLQVLMCKSKHSFSKYGSSTSFLPGLVQGTSDSTLSKTDLLG